MRFVEETGGLWTAEQLRAAEAEIEQQKREWEANRVAALKQEEEDARRVEEEEDNSMLTYSQEDAKNQVNMKNKPINRRLLKVKNSEMMNRRGIKRRVGNGSGSSVRAGGNLRGKGNLGSRALKRRQFNAVVENKRRRLTRLRNSVAQSSATESTTTTPSTKKSNSKNPTPKKRPLRRNVTVKSESEGDDSVPTTSYNSDSQCTAEINHQTGDGDFDDSECSLDVMIDSTDAQDSDSKSGKHSYSTAQSDGEENDDNDDDDDDDDQDQDQEEDSNDSHDNENASDASGGEKENDKRKNGPKNIRRISINNHIDINGPRTRSEGTVKLNLWTLDVSPILPKIRSKRSFDSDKSKNLSNASNESVSKKSINESDPLALDETNGRTNKDDDISMHSDSECKSFGDTTKALKPAKILDGFASTKSPKNRKIFKKKSSITSATHNGSKCYTLDAWINQSPRTIRAMSPKVVLSKDDANIVKHLRAETAASKESPSAYLIRTRRSSVFIRETNTENPPN